MDTLEQYRNAVKDYAERGVDYLFHNEGDEHALIIFTNIFLFAERIIRIAANKLCNNEVVNQEEYIKSLKGFLDKKDTYLHIILSNRPSVEEANQDNCLYKMIFDHRAYKEGRVKIKDGEGKSFHDKNGKTIHFCTGDDKIYRIENDIKARKAVANFGDIKTTGVLNKAFDEVFRSVNVFVNLNDYYESK